MSNDEAKKLIERMKAMPDRLLADKLRDGDNDAWLYVKMRVVIPVARGPRMQQIMIDRQRTEDDLWAALFEKMVWEKKIDLCRFESPLVYWMRNWVVKEIFEYCEKNDPPVSDETFLSVLLDEPAKESNYVAKEAANWYFKKLWAEDSLMARVVYLKIYEYRSAKEIVRLLNITSEANVNQIYSRAIKKMRSYSERNNATSPFRGVAL